ncbi:MAG: hypothetical protein KME19_04720 [Microcoleus vaginatus WJT46-NPBG5]|nr:hypothetical protein [Microcoleus vaginatus WJT46-NPBG5]
MPGNWRPYIGVELDNLEQVVERIANEPGILERISVAGRGLLRIMGRLLRLFVFLR